MMVGICMAGWCGERRLLWTPGVHCASRNTMLLHTPFTITCSHLLPALSQRKLLPAGLILSCALQLPMRRCGVGGPIGCVFAQAFSFCAQATPKAKGGEGAARAPSNHIAAE